MLKTLRIDHFRSIQSAEIEFNQVTVFVGPNGSGKTNVVDALRFLRDAAQNGLDRAFSDRHGAGSVRQWSPTKPFRIAIAAEFKNPDAIGSYAVQIDSAKGEFSVFREDFETRSLQTFDFEEAEEDESIVIRRQLLHRAQGTRNRLGDIRLTRWQAMRDFDEHRTFDPEDLQPWLDIEPDVTEERAGARDELMVNQRSWLYGEIRRFLTGFQAYSIFPNTLRLPQEPSNETFLTSEGRNLASIFKRMARNKGGVEAIGQITFAMQQIIPNLDRISIVNAGGFFVPQFHMVEPGPKRHTFNVAQMSDGSLRVLGLLTALYQFPRPAIIALEEPEQTIHPGAMAILAESIKEVSRRCQVVITTHSPYLLDQFAPSQVRAVELRDGGTQIARISSSQLRAVQKRLFTMGELLVGEGLHVG